MEYLTGKTEKKTLGIQDILAGEYEGKEVTVNGAVHKIRDMGDVAFVVLRKSEGLLQTVYEDGVTDISLKELQEEDTVCVTGVVAKEERAPHGFEIRLRTVTILSKPTEPMPIAINKWKMSVRNLESRKESSVDSGIFCMSRALPKSIRQKSAPEVLRAVQTYSVSNIFINMLCLHKARSFTNR